MKTYITEHKQTKEWGKRIPANTWKKQKVNALKITL